MKIKLLALSFLFATASVHFVEATNQECTYGWLPDKSIKIAHYAVLLKRFYHSSDAVKNLLKETRLLEQLSGKRIHLLDLSMRLDIAYIEYYTEHLDLDDATHAIIRDSYAEIVRKILQESPEEAEILIAYEMGIRKKSFESIE